MDKLISKLGIDEKYTKNIKKQKKVYDSVKQNIPCIEDYNYMADILMLPETKKGYKYLLVCVDLASDEFDIEMLKTKTPKEVLKGFLSMFKREHIKEPKASIRTDGGAEFKGAVNKWFNDHKIMHKIAEPSRHQQLANVERLNRDLGRLLNGFMNSHEEKDGRQFKEWGNAVEIIRDDLNDLRKKTLTDPFSTIYQVPDSKEPEYKIGDLVYRKSEVPLDALGNKQPTTTFRMGDYRYELQPRKIKRVLPYPKNVRYVLEFLPHVSYAEWELLPAKEKDQMFVVKKIINKKIEKRKTYYLVWWQGYLKKDATWEDAKTLKEQVPQMVEDYEVKH